MIAAVAVVVVLAAGDLQQELEAIHRQVAAVTSVEARFTEKTFTPLLREPMVRAGTLRAVAGVSRWDTTSPDRSTTIVTAEAITIYYPQDHLLETWELSSQLGRLASSPIPDLDTIRSMFTIDAADAAPGMLGLRLTPIEAALREHVDHVRLDIERNTGIVKRMAISTTGGDRTEVVLEKVKLDSGITAADLTLEVPPGTRKVTRRRPPNPDGAP